MIDDDNFFTILFELNRNWKLGRNGRAWQLWKRNPHTNRFALETSFEGSRRKLVAEIERRPIYLTREAEEKLKTLPELLQPWPIERAEES